jgi:DNA-binding LytR/AlgR family response regulator
VTTAGPAAGAAPRLRALVLEDEWPARNYLVELLEASQLAEVVGAVATVEEAREALDPAVGPPVDVVFVDVQLAGAEGALAGLDLIRSMVVGPRAPMFVLATAHGQHALEAFDLGVVDYVLKPFNEERVAQCLRRLLERRPAGSVPRGGKRVVARRKRSLVFLEPDEIWAFEAADRLTFVHSRHGRFDIDLSLAAIEASFGRTLTRVHRNWLVNLAWVKELERADGGTMLFVGVGVEAEGEGIRVPVSRDRAQALRELLLANATGLRHP